MEKENEALEEFAIYDPVDHLVTIILSERVVYTLTLEEFSDFYTGIKNTFECLSEEDDLVVGETYDTETKLLRKVLMLKPSEADLN